MKMNEKEARLEKDIKLLEEFSHLFSKIQKINNNNLALWIMSNQKLHNTDFEKFINDLNKFSRRLKNEAMDRVVFLELFPTLFNHAANLYKKIIEKDENFKEEIMKGEKNE